MQLLDSIIWSAVLIFYSNFWHYYQTRQAWIWIANPLSHTHTHNLCTLSVFDCASISRRSIALGNCHHIVLPRPGDYGGLEIVLDTGLCDQNYLICYINQAGFACPNEFLSGMSLNPDAECWWPNRLTWLSLVCVSKNIYCRRSSCPNNIQYIGLFLVFIGMALPMSLSTALIKPLSSPWESNFVNCPPCIPNDLNKG
jgi:hypothetical protein